LELSCDRAFGFCEEIGEGNLGVRSLVRYNLGKLSIATIASTKGNNIFSGKHNKIAVLRLPTKVVNNIKQYYFFKILPK
jgi:hypothetical protein